MTGPDEIGTNAPMNRKAQADSHKEVYFETFRSVDRSFLSHHQFGLSLPANSYNKI